MFFRKSKTLIAIRCVDYSPAVEHTAEQMKSFIPGAEAVFVSDQRRGPQEFPDGLDVIAITDEKLDSLGLFHQRDNVGWACGDYCYYAALERQWDSLWLVEPDVGFFGDAGDIITKAHSSNADLIGVRIGDRDDDWAWHSRLKRVSNFTETKGVFFPLTRVSRKLAMKALDARQAMTANLLADPRSRVPNDESVVATVAITAKMKTLDLKTLNPHAFEKFHWRPPLRWADIEATGETLIAHPVFEDEGYAKKVGAKLAEAMRGAGMKEQLAVLDDDMLNRVIRASLGR